MPFTPYHLGPALGVGLPFRRMLHVPTFIVANMILDLEPFLVIYFGLKYPFHGHLHTFIGAFAVGLTLACVMFILERRLHLLFTALLLESKKTLTLTPFVFAGVLGTTFHVLLDSLLHEEMWPFLPLLTNPLYRPDFALEVHSFCVWMGVVGVIAYGGYAVRWLFKDIHKIKQPINTS